MLALLGAAAALAQTGLTVMAPITVQAAGVDPVQVNALSDEPLARTPLSATAIDAQRIAQAGAVQWSQLLKFDASASDAYNTPGYWSYATVRGYVLDNRSNYRREGMPISAETSIALFNKSRVELLKGTSGLQSGTSSPGGLVNFGVKRPTVSPIRQIALGTDNWGQTTLQADVSQRFGESDAWGVRVNLSQEQLNSAANNPGSGRHGALALQYVPFTGAALDVEWESSQRSQASVPGNSLWGGALPAADARLSINNQAWALPVVLAGDTGSVRWSHQLGGGWRYTATVARQTLRSDDRVIFPFGCTDANGDYVADRYCPDGSADLYDFRSDNERRRQTSVALTLAGQWRLGATTHELRLGVLRSSVQERFQAQAYNYVGTAQIGRIPALGADPTLGDPNTNRDERSTELSASDRIGLAGLGAPGTALWLGLRHTALERNSVRTDGSRPVAYAQTFNTPWLALTHRLSPELSVYASASQGIESEAVPNRRQYTNAGAALPALRSRQAELGLKHASANEQWAATLWRISRPVSADFGTCAATRDCTRRIDGSADHQGLELSTSQRLSGTLAAWRLGASAMWLHAVRAGSANPAINGLAPTNVPTRVLRADANYTVAALSGLSLQAHVSHEGPRAVLPDNSIQLPGWSRVDLGARYVLRAGSLNWVATAALDNVGNRAFFKESPYQFGHSYLFATSPRTVRLGLSADL